LAVASIAANPARDSRKYTAPFRLR